MDFDILYSNNPRGDLLYETKLFVREGINEPLMILSATKISPEEMNRIVYRKVKEKKSEK